MYIPLKYQISDLEAVKEFINNNAFAILVNQADDKPLATHIPLELEVDDTGKEVLVGHIAKANPQWKYFDPEKEILCIFNGPHAYVSSSWYKAEEVPTWNYIAVHVYGHLQILDEAAVLRSLHKLVNKYERNSEHPLSLHDLSKKTMRQIKGIVGFKIVINEIQAAYKLSQGREEDYPKIVEKLKERGQLSSEVAAEMQKKINLNKDQ